MILRQLVAAGVLLGIAAVATAAPPGKTDVKIVEKFKGEVALAPDKQPELKSEAITTEAEWKTVWELVSPGKKLPEVDFSKSLLLVSTQDKADPNHRGANAWKSADGALELMEMSTLIGFRPSHQMTYRFYEVSREGVTGISHYDPAQKKNVVVPLEPAK